MGEYDVIVLGAGAAGMMCARHAGAGGKKVAILEHADRAGKKILISGGGRCNFTNLHTRPENFLSQNPHFAKSALARYRPQDFIALVEKHGIAYHEKTLGQLFCDGTARQIVTMLEAECAVVGVTMLLGTQVASVERDRDFLVRTNAGELRAAALVVATGGLSIPKMGATPLGYQVAEQFGIGVVECRPALVPLLLGLRDREQFCDLAGVSAEVVATAGGRSFREKMLITHRGLSGPAVLQASSYWQPEGRSEDAIRIDLAPGVDVTASMRAVPSGRNYPALVALLRQHWPQRLADRWIKLHAPPDATNRSLEAFERGLHAWQINPAGTEGYEKAEVTAGGVDTNELSAKTMESKPVPGLYFVGEVVDVTGQLGGYNFQWAWASGAAAGRALGGAE